MIKEELRQITIELSPTWNIEGKRNNQNFIKITYNVLAEALELTGVFENKYFHHIILKGTIDKNLLNLRVNEIQGGYSYSFSDIKELLYLVLMSFKRFGDTKLMRLYNYLESQDCAYSYLIEYKYIYVEKEER
jgi:hypothetical protein